MNIRKVILYITYLIPITLVLTSCEKEEKPIVLPPANDSVMMVSATMGDQYRTQVFVNIETGQTWPADNESWDLQFESDDDGNMIWMNGGKAVLIGNTGNTKIKNLGGSKVYMRWDDASGMRDSTVLGNWCDNDNESRDSVYIIDRGDRCRPNERFYQFQIISVSNNKYVIRFANPDGSMLRDNVIIPKDPNKEHVYFSFGHGGQALNFEPDKNDWHFCYTRYRWIYYEFKPPLLYGVCGIHINTKRIEVAVDSTLNFDNVRMSDVAGLNFSNRRDVMGFDWKVPDFFSPTGIKYNCRTFVNYFIKDKQRGGPMRKLRFIGFYDKHGVKGSPQFEVMKMH